MRDDAHRVWRRCYAYGKGIMMSETMQKVTRLTQGQMDTIVYAIAGEGEVAGVLATWEILLGGPLRDYEGPQLVASEYAIPEVQWHALCEGIIARERLDSTHDGMIGGTWMNAGPSGFREVAGEGS